MIYMFLSNNPSSGDINSSNLPCLILGFFVAVNFILNKLTLYVSWSGRAVSDSHGVLNTTFRL